MQNRIELVFGLVGPVGSLTHEAGENLTSAIKKMDYKPTTISLSKEMDRLLAAKDATFKDELTSVLHNKIRKGNAVRKKFGNNAVLASEAIRQIIDFRRECAVEAGEQDPVTIDDKICCSSGRACVYCRPTQATRRSRLAHKNFWKAIYSSVSRDAFRGKETFAQR